MLNMDEKKLIMILSIVAILLFLASYLGSKSPLDIVGIATGILILIAIFYSKGKKINVSVSYAVATISVNIIQWLILIYTFYYSPIYVTTVFYAYLIFTLLITLTLARQILKINPDGSENVQNTKISILKDKTKLILLVTFVIVIIGSLACFITYFYPLFLYGVTLGLMAFIYGFYHGNKKFNASIRYAVAMGSVLLLQWIIFVYFFYQISIDDLSVAFLLSINITTLFSIQIYRSDLTISNEKKENIIGIFAIAIFILFFGALSLKGYI